MPFFDNLSKKVGDAAKTAAKKSGDLVEVTKLNRAISTEEEKIGKLYAEIGKAVYSKFENNDVVDQDIAPWCQQIAEANRNIESIREKILQIKNVRVCPNCKTEVGPNIVFCPSCGTKLEMPVEEPEVSEQPNADEKVCPSCGAKLSPDTAFCSNCGNKL